MAESKTRTTRLTRAALLLGGFFALDKGVAFVRQVIIAQQFGLSVELDAFNVANNLPDMLFALISGGALAMAFIPVLSEVLNRDGQKPPGISSAGLPTWHSWSQPDWLWWF